MLSTRLLAVAVSTLALLGSTAATVSPAAAYAAASRSDIVDLWLLDNGRLRNVTHGVVFADESDLSAGAGPLRVGNGPITTEWSTGSGLLTWSNAAFASGSASFCVNPDKTLIGVYNGQTPNGCETVQLAVQGTFLAAGDRYVHATGNVLHVGSLVELP